MTGTVFRPWIGSPDEHVFEGQCNYMQMFIFYFLACLAKEKNKK
jgi:hypothetical protein